MNVKAPSGRRKRLITSILVLAALIGVVAGVRHVWQGQWYESTDNAYLTGNLLEVSAQVDGTVVWIGPEQNQLVRRGEEVLRLADGDARELLALRENELALAVQDVLTMRAEVDRLLTEQQLRAVTHDLAQDEFERRQQLLLNNMVSKEELDAARTREAETSVSLESAGLALVKAQVRAGTQPLHEHPLIMVSAAQLRLAYRNWRKTHIISPVDGEVAQRRAQAGQRVTEGQPLFSIAERGSAWVEANFKETQLGYLRPGQPVELESDLYGDDAILTGRVESVGVGTGSVFSLLPPQNATGNWIKIVQRVPVRIAMDKIADDRHPLPFGASMSVRVDTHDRRGPLTPLVDTTETPIVDADVYGYQEEGLEALISQIIANNHN